MEWHQYFRLVCECWIVLIYDTGRGVQADQKDGVAKMISMIKHQPELVRSFSVGKAIMIMGFIFYSCEEESTDIDDITDYGVVINEINYN